MNTVAENQQGALPAALTIDNCAPRLDTNGDSVDAHDGCVEQFGDRFYWYGTAYGDTDGWTTSNFVACYSSPDLRSWTNHGAIMHGGENEVLWRPYAKRHPGTGLYVLWYDWHDRDRHGRHYRVAMAPSPTGPFEVVTESVAASYPKVGDPGLFVDDDGRGYLIYTAEVGAGQNHAIVIERLNEDWSAMTGDVSDVLAVNCEGPCLIKHAGTYYAFFDNTCCFCANGSGVRVYTAEAPLGPYTYQGNINRRGNSPENLESPWTKPGTGREDAIIPAQQTNITRFNTAAGASWVWQGDLWHSAADGVKGHDRQVWQPLRFDAQGRPRQLSMQEQWHIPLENSTQ